MATRTMRARRIQSAPQGLGPQRAQRPEIWLNQSGRLLPMGSKRTPSLGNTSFGQANSNGWIVNRQDANGFMAALNYTTYNSATPSINGGNLQLVTFPVGDPMAKTVSIFYSPQDDPVLASDSLGNTAMSQFDPLHRQVFSTDALGNSGSVTFN